MSSLLENHLISLPLKNENDDSKQTCWELLSCHKVLCPAHDQDHTDCWLIPGTHCGNFLEEDFFKKLPHCLTCSYFKIKSKEHSKGWNHFLADQIHKYNIKALERLYQKEESFVEILNRIPDGLFTTDQEWRITYFNPAAEKITGFSAYDAVGMFCKDVFKNPICESDCALKRAVAEGHDIHDREYAITNIDGRKVPIICSTSAFQDASGRVMGGLEIFKDISENKKLQEEIVRRERKYRRIFEGSHDMIYTTNPPGDILDMNQAGVDLMGYSNIKELVQKVNVTKLYRNGKDRDRFIKIINRDGFTKDFEVEFSKKDGSPIHVLISSRRYENHETAEVEYEGIIKDITHRKRSEQTIKERNRELSILNSVAVALNNTLDLNHILKVTLEDVLEALRLESGALFLIDPSSQKISLQVKTGLPDQLAEEPMVSIFKDVKLGKYLMEKNSPLTPKPSFPCFKMRYKAVNGTPAPWLSCFLITFKGKAVGFFGFQIPSWRELNQYEIHLLGSLGNFLGGPIENARLMQTVRLHRQELRQLTERLFESQEEERRRIALELHDEAGQSLMAVNLGLDRLEENYGTGDKHIRYEINEIRKMITRTSSEIRRLSYNLHPTLLIDLGLEPALNLYFKEIENNSNLKIDFNMVGFNERLDPETETILYRFSQETLTNTLKHSGAGRFKLSIIKSFPLIIFAAEDNGKGFDDNIITKDARSLGLIGMRERCSFLGGTFHLTTISGKGTRIRINIPHKEEATYA